MAETASALRFNGAAFFQSGKYCSAKLEKAQDELQWSRFFSKRKIVGRGRKYARVVLLQWSRFFSKRKIVIAKSGNVNTYRLQWSRFFSKRKMVLDFAGVVERHGRFNGAAFFQSGKYHPGVRAYRAPGLLQWSRFFSKRKMGVARLAGCNKLDVASMEPLFFKAENTWTPRSNWKGFIGLQWSRFFSKRKMDEAAYARHLKEAWASMEPLFFKAENYMWGRTTSRSNFASMEPLFFKAENADRRQLETETPCFNGAAFFQSGK